MGEGDDNWINDNEGGDGQRRWWWWLLEHVVDLFLKSTGEHLIGLVQHEELDRVQTQGSALDHVIDTTGGADHHVHTILQGADVVTDRGTTHTSVDLDVHEVAQRADHFLDLQGELSDRWERERTRARLEGCMLVGKVEGMPEARWW